VLLGLGIVSVQSVHDHQADSDAHHNQRDNDQSTCQDVKHFPGQVHRHKKHIDDDKQLCHQKEHFLVEGQHVKALVDDLMCKVRHELKETLTLKEAHRLIALKNGQVEHNPE
jgi:hypothetical protein